MIYVVLGMHKSGTTLLSQILHHSGINMGDDLVNGVSYDKGNQYERESTWRLNEDILGAREVRSIHIAPPPASLTLNQSQRHRMRSIIETCTGRYDDWGFKDPRTCLLYPLWAEELPPHKLIVVYRDPSEPWPRYRPRHWRNRYREPILAWQYLRSWCDHNLRILSYLATTPNAYLVLSYQKLVTTDAEFDRLRRFVGYELDDRRRPDLYRNRAETYPALTLAGRLLATAKGYRPDVIYQQLEAYRQ